MKCPKCSYISFDGADRCRNCGYDFTLSAPARGGGELPLQDGSALGAAPVDLPLDGSESATGKDPAVAPGPRRSTPSPLAPATDLPLFDEPVPGVDDTPLITTPAPPRPPLAVRRATAEAPRPQTGPTSGGSRPSPARAPGGLLLESRTASQPGGAEGAAAGVAGFVADAVPAWRRATAALIDAAILGGIDVAVVYLTLRLTDLDFGRIGALPLAPLVAFLALLDGGYLVGFTTASGQTLGKMLTGLRVVGEGTPTVSLASAIVRAAAMLLTVGSLGIGYLPALAGRGRPALHDRLAHTAVVRV